MKLDNWQIEVVKHEGNVTIRGGRQVGKSLAVAKRIVYFAKKYPGSVSLIIAASERQESYLLDKVMVELGKHKFRIRPTLTRLWLDNDSRILKYPVGKTGEYVKGEAIDFLYCDEAMFIPERVYKSVLPMLVISREKGLGWETLLSTTDKEPVGYFFESFSDPDFKEFTISAEECPRISEEYLKKQKEKLSNKEYRTIWLAEFIEEFNKYFTREIIEKAMDFKIWSSLPNKKYDYFLGIDIAGRGRDKEAYVCGELKKGKLKAVHYETLTESTMQDTINMTEKLDEKLDFGRIYIDSAGIGIGYEDIMTEKFERRVIGLNNAKKSEEGGRILKEDLYSNCLRLMEQGILKLKYDEELKNALLAIRLEEGKISGRNDHIVEALVRMCWCMKEEGLNLWVEFS